MRPLLLVAAFLVGGCADTSQTEACRSYVRCIEALDAASGRDTDLDRFRASGACWGGTVEGQATCDLACGNGLAWLQTHHEGLPEECL